MRSEINKEDNEILSRLPYDFTYFIDLEQKEQFICLLVTSEKQDWKFYLLTRDKWKTGLEMYI